MTTLLNYILSRSSIAYFAEFSSYFTNFEDIAEIL